MIRVSIIPRLFTVSLSSTDLQVANEINTGPLTQAALAALPVTPPVGTVKCLGINSTVTTYASSAVEQDVVEFILGTNVDAGDVVRLTSGGIPYNYSGSSTIMTWRFYINGTLVMTHGPITYATSSNPAVGFEFTAALVSDTSQSIQLEANGGATATNGNGTTGVTSTATSKVGYANTTVDTSTVATFKMTVQRGASHANNRYIHQFSTIERLRTT